MPVSVTTNFRVGDVKFSSARIMRDVGLLARETIVRRTRRGEGSDGQRFRPYSASYATHKTRALGLASPVNLTASGGMLNALQVIETTDRRVTLGFV